MAYRLNTTYRGSYVAAGLFYPCSPDDEHLGSTYSEQTMRSELCATFKPNNRIFRIQDLGYLLLFDEPRRAHSTQERGLLVCATAGGYSTVPSEPAAIGGFCVAVAGKIHNRNLATEQLVDPAQWLATANYQLLVPPPSTVKVKAKALSTPSRTRESQKVLAGIPEISNQARDVQAAFAKGEDLVANDLSSKTLSHLRLPRRSFQKWISALFARSALSRAFGRRQAKYLQNLFRLLDDGDTESALRHAIPLGDRISQWGGFTWGTPKPRSDFAISASGGTSYSYVRGGFDLTAMLRERYERIAKRLEQQQNYERAAYVWAELIGNAAKAVSLLELHGMPEKAAEIAEFKQLEPELIVRLWFLAGDIDRALLIANRTGCYISAITRLEESHPKLAQQLRLLWGHQLADKGDYLAAIDAIWPIEKERSLAAGWAALGVSAGGPMAARLLVRRTVFPELAHSHEENSLIDLLDTTHTDQLYERRAAFNEMTRLSGQTAETRDALGLVADRGIRAILRDAGTGYLPAPSRADINQLGGTAASVLLADLPSLATLKQPSEPVKIKLLASDRGSRPAFDYVLLPSGRALVAEGELGVTLLSRNNRIVKRFDEPAVQLVIADNGTRALALIPRDHYIRISLLRLDSLQSTLLGDLELDHWADSFDGREWMIAKGKQLIALDVSGTAPKVTWQIDNVGKQGVQRIARNEASLWLVAGDNEHQLWRYELPALTLRARDPFPTTTASLLGVLSCDEGKVLATFQETEPAATEAPLANVQLRSWEEGEDWRMVAENIPPNAVAALSNDSGIAWLLTTDEGVEVQFSRSEQPFADLTLVIEGVTADQLSMRLYNAHLHLCDQQGRALAVALKQRTLVRDVRI